MKRNLQMILLIAAGVAAGAILHECKGPGTSGLRPQHSAGVEALPCYDTIPYFDTIPYYLPVAKQEISLGTQITFLPVFIPRDSAGSGAEAPAQGQKKGHGASEDVTEGRAAVKMTARHDSVAVEIPITQREYEGEEYHAWVSGYDPKLDSIFVFPRHDVVTIREPPNKPKRWGIGLFAGYGYTPQGFQPCIGISINYNLWNF